jgi:ATP-dependent DNA helicase RecG
LISSHSGKGTRERLKKLCDCHDGFELAKYDLKTRGPGEFFGTRQSGFGGVDITSEISMSLLETVTMAAKEFIDKASEKELSPYGVSARFN